MRRSDKYYGGGLLLTLFGGAGLAEYVTSGRGSFLLSTVIFSIGFASVLVSYTQRR